MDPSQHMYDQDMEYDNSSTDYVDMGPDYERLGSERASLPPDHIYEISTKSTSDTLNNINHKDPERNGPTHQKKSGNGDQSHVKCERRTRRYRHVVIGLVVLSILLVVAVFLAYFIPNMLLRSKDNSTGNSTDAIKRLSTTTAAITVNAENTYTSQAVSSSSDSTTSPSTSSQAAEPSDDKDCRDGWTRNDASCYILGSSYKTWEEANRSCSSSDYHSHNGRKSHLLTINDLKEYDYIEDTLLELFDYPHTQLWLGGHWDSDKDAWVWLDSGSRIPESWPQWGYRGPSSTSVGTCLCISTSTQYTGQLFDYSCNSERPYACEYNI